MVVSKSDILNYLAALPDDQFFTAITGIADKVQTDIITQKTSVLNEQLTSLNNQAVDVQTQITALQETQSLPLDSGVGI